MQRLAIANLLGGASPQGGRFQMPELGKGFMSPGPMQKPFAREMAPLPVLGQDILPLAAGGPTGGVNQGPAPTGDPGAVTGGINQGPAPRLDPQLLTPTGGMNQGIGAPFQDMPVTMPKDVAIGDPLIFPTPQPEKQMGIGMLG